MTATRFPIESFDPRYKRILLEGALRERIFTFENEKKAARFQARLHLFRAQVRKQKPEEATRLYRARTSRKGKIVRVYPADLDFEDALSQVGSAPSAPQIMEEKLPPVSATPAIDAPASNGYQTITVDELFTDLDPYEDKE